MVFLKGKEHRKQKTFNKALFGFRLFCLAFVTLAPNFPLLASNSIDIHFYNQTWLTKVNNVNHYDTPSIQRNYKLLSSCSSHVSFEILRESVRTLSLALSIESDSRSNCRSCLFCSSCIPSARLLICCRTFPISAASASVTDLEFFAVLAGTAQREGRL